MVYLILIVGSIVVAILTAVAADWRWPNAPWRRLAILSGLLGPGVILLAYPLTLLWLWTFSTGNREADVDGMLIIVIGMMISIGVVCSSVFGIPAAYLTIRFLRRP